MSVWFHSIFFYFAASTCFGQVVTTAEELDRLNEKFVSSSIAGFATVGEGEARQQWDKGIDEWQKKAKKIQSQAAFKAFQKSSAPYQVQVNGMATGFSLICPVMQGMSVETHTKEECDQLIRDAGGDPPPAGPPVMDGDPRTPSPKNTSRNRPNGAPGNSGAQATSAKGDTGKAGKEKKASYKANDFFNGAQAANIAGLKGQTPAKTCDYAKTAPLRRKFNQMQNECSQKLGPAVAACNPEKQRPIKEAIAEAKQAANMVAKSIGKSVTAACDRFSKSTQNLKKALENYKSKCMPLKAECENKCMATTRTGAEIGDTIGDNPYCGSVAIASIDDINKVSVQAKNNFVRCKSFDKPLKSAHDDAQALLSTLERSNSCEKLTVENCRLDATTGDCVDPALSQVDALAKLETSSSSAADGAGENSLAGTESQLPAVNVDEFESFATGAAAFAKNKALDKSDGQSGMGATGVRGGNNKALRGGGNSYKVGSEWSSRRGKRRKRRTKYKFGKYSFDSSTGKKKNKGRGPSSDSESLAKYLPGGANDPKRKNLGLYADGVTGANGPSIFDKVSRRYDLYKPRLLSVDGKIIKTMGN